MSLEVSLESCSDLWTVVLSDIASECPSYWLTEAFLVVSSEESPGAAFEGSYLGISERLLLESCERSTQTSPERSYEEHSQESKVALSETLSEDSSD